MRIPNTIYGIFPSLGVLGFGNSLSSPESSSHALLTEAAFTRTGVFAESDCETYPTMTFST